MAKTEDRSFFSVQDGIRGRNGGPYSDTSDAEQAEIRRAKAEGRKPDLDNPPPTVGQTIVLSHMVEDNLFSNPSMAATKNVVADGLHDLKEKAAKDTGATAGFAPVKLPVDTRTEVEESDKLDAKTAAKLAADPVNVAFEGAADTQGNGASVKKSAASKTAAANRVNSK